MPKASIGTFNTERKYFKDVFMTLLRELQCSYRAMGSKEGFTATSAARDCPVVFLGHHGAGLEAPALTWPLAGHSRGQLGLETLQGWEIQPHLEFLSPSWEFVSKLGLHWFKSRAAEIFIEDRYIPLS